MNNYEDNINGKNGHYENDSTEQEKETPTFKASPVTNTGNDNNKSDTTDITSASARNIQQSYSYQTWSSPHYYSPTYYSSPKQNFNSQDSGQVPSYSPQNSWNYYAGKQPPKKKSNLGLKITAIVVSSILVFGIIYFATYGAIAMFGGNIGNLPENNVVSQQDELKENENAPTLDIQSTPDNQDTAKSGGQLSTTQIAKKLSPSVVGIATYSREIIEVGQGSGIIMSKDGYIITNAHVVSGNGVDSIKVILSNSDEFIAELIALDRLTDLAVLKIDTGKKELVPATFGSSDNLEVGETVIAIGNPGGISFAGSVTQGIISAVNRPIGETENYAMRYIQTDAAINPGNSGGPLVNVYGQVIGINTAKIIASGYEGMGFAIPISTAKPIIDDLIRYGYVRNRIKLGVTGSIITKNMADLYGMPIGLRVYDIVEGSDLAAKGVQRYDIITKANGKEIVSMKVLYDELQKLSPGQTIRLEIYRNYRGNIKTFTVDVKVYEDKGNQ